MPRYCAYNQPGNGWHGLGRTRRSRNLVDNASHSDLGCPCSQARHRNGVINCNHGRRFNNYPVRYFLASRPGRRRWSLARGMASRTCGVGCNSCSSLRCSSQRYFAAATSGRWYQSHHSSTSMEDCCLLLHGIRFRRSIMVPILRLIARERPQHVARIHHEFVGANGNWWCGWSRGFWSLERPARTASNHVFGNSYRRCYLPVSSRRTDVDCSSRCDSVRHGGYGGASLDCSFRS